MTRGNGPHDSTLFPSFRFPPKSGRGDVGGVARGSVSELRRDACASAGRLISTCVIQPRMLANSCSSLAAYQFERPPCAPGKARASHRFSHRFNRSITVCPSYRFAELDLGNGREHPTFRAALECVSAV